MSLTVDAVKAALSGVMDPNTGKDLVSSRSVKNIKVDGDDVSFDVELGYPAKSQIDGIRKSAISAVRAVRIVRADKMDFIAQHPLKSDPDVGLDILHNVTDMERAVCVGQGGGDEQSARRWGAHLAKRL